MSRYSRWLTAVTSCLLTLLLLVGCDRERERHTSSMAGGNAQAGREDAKQFGCGGCHVIPGVRGAHGLVGPPLAGFANRMYIGGVLPNTPDNLVRWIHDPPAIDSLTAMPDLGVDEATARDIAEYLYTLR
jgi:cytochrome c2